MSTHRGLDPAPTREISRARGVDCTMSDEMVQEKTETAEVAAPENGHADGHAGNTADEASVSSLGAASPAATEEPAPAQPVASEPAADMSLQEPVASPDTAPEPAS